MSNSDSDSEPEVQDQPEETQAHVKEILQKAKTIMPSYDESTLYQIYKHQCFSTEHVLFSRLEMIKRKRYIDAEQTNHAQHQWVNVGKKTQGNSTSTPSKPKKSYPNNERYNFLKDFKLIQRAKRFSQEGAERSNNNQQAEAQHHKKQIRYKEKADHEERNHHNQQSNKQSKQQYQEKKPKFKEKEDKTVQPQEIKHKDIKNEQDKQAQTKSQVKDKPIQNQPAQNKTNKYQEKKQSKKEQFAQKKQKFVQKVVEKQVVPKAEEKIQSKPIKKQPVVNAVNTESAPVANTDKPVETKKSKYQEKPASTLNPKKEQTVSQPAKQQETKVQAHEKVPEKTSGSKYKQKPAEKIEQKINNVRNELKSSEEVEKEFAKSCKQNAFVLKYVKPSDYLQRVSYIRQPNGDIKKVDIRETRSQKNIEK